MQAKVTLDMYIILCENFPGNVLLRNQGHYKDHIL